MVKTSLTPGKKVGVIGATGAVGVEMVKVLHERKFPIASLKLFASERSAGKEIDTPFGKLVIERYSVEAARDMDIVFMAVSGSFALEHAPKISEQPGGAVVIDNSSAFRYQPNIPLVIPEINGHKAINAPLIANPNCTTAIAAMALWPLHCKYGLKKVIISTYQAASGAGAEGMDELRSETAAYLDGKNAGNKIFAHPLPFNVVPHIDSFQENGYTKEEMKVAWETKKIFDCSQINVSCTAVRVPTFRAHAEAITIETVKEITPEAARAILQGATGVKLVDNPEHKEYPMPLTATAKYDVEVGRIRQSLIYGKKGLDLFVCGDQLLRGAALNAVLIAEALEHPSLQFEAPKFDFGDKSVLTLTHTEAAGLVASVAATASLLTYALVKNT